MENSEEDVGSIISSSYRDEDARFPYISCLMLTSPVLQVELPQGLFAPGKNDVFK